MRLPKASPGSPKRRLLSRARIPNWHGRVHQASEGCLWPRKLLPLYDAPVRAYPIVEVAVLFFGIFLTMIPPLDLLQVRGGELGVREP